MIPIQEICEPKHLWQLGVFSMKFGINKKQKYHSQRKTNKFVELFYFNSKKLKNQIKYFHTTYNNLIKNYKYINKGI